MLNPKQEQLLTEAKLHMLRLMPYYGMFVIGTPLVPRDDIETAATDMQSIMFNPTWLLGQDGEVPREEVVRVLGHEVLHMTFKHGLRQRYREPGRWNVACLRGDTPITMADGTIKPIRGVIGGDVVSSPLGVNRVRLVTRTSRRDMVELRIGNRSVVTTNAHLFLTPDGFIPAGQIKDGTTIIVDAGVQGIRGQKLSVNDPLGVGFKSWLHVPASRELPQTSRIESEAPFLVMAFGSQSSLKSGSLGVHGWDCGRRGNNLHWSRDGEGQAILSPPHHDQHDITRVGGMGRRDRPVWHSPEEQQRAALLESYGFRLGDRVATSWDEAVFTDQSSARRLASLLHCSSTQASQELHELARVAGNLSASEGVECARVTYSRTYTEVTEVYDLVTDHHCYIANGMVVHNCDFAINPILEDGQVGVYPTKVTDRLIDARFTGKSAEDIYDLLEKEQQKKGGKGKQKINLNGMTLDLSKPDPGGMGGFSQPLNADGTPLSSSQAADLERSLDTRISSSAAAAKSQGKLPAGLERFLQIALKPEIDWRERLWQFVTKVIPADITWTRPKRRFLWQDLYLPSTLKTGTGPILVIMDTSGSISFDGPNSEGGQFAAEIKSIHEDVKPEKLYVMYCDAEVAPDKSGNRIDVFLPEDEFILKPRGGGGTDFRPPFKLADKEALDIQCAIYLTDMYGTFPEKQPPYPVMWVATSDTVGPFGETIRIMRR